MRAQVMIGMYVGNSLLHIVQMYHADHVKYFERFNKWDRAQKAVLNLFY